jgi:hypothetical protein
MALIVNIIDGEIKTLFENTYLTSVKLADKFPFGEVYVRMAEPANDGTCWVLQWRVLCRGSRIDDKRWFYDALMPIAVKDLPECVQLVHLCTE